MSPKTFVLSFYACGLVVLGVLLALQLPDWWKLLGGPPIVGGIFLMRAALRAGREDVHQ